MRRLFWCGTAAVVAVAAGVYLAARQACHYPDSLAGRGALLVFHLGRDFNPVTLLTTQVREQVAAYAQKMAAARSPAPAATCPAQHVPGTAPNPADTFPVEQLARDHLDELIRTGRAVLGGTQEGEGVQPACRQVPDQECMPALADAGAGVTVEPVATGDNEESPRQVPPACADEEEPAPSTMPYIDDGEDAADQVPCQTAEPEVAEEAAPEESPKDKESRCAHSFVDFWMALWHEAVPEAGTAAGESDAAGAAEESEPAEEHLSDCQEDPDSPRQYPGCPYPGVEGGKKSPIPVQKTSHGKPAQHPDCDGDEQGPAPAHVDTTEFRPSDARAGEFDSRPM